MEAMSFYKNYLLGRAGSSECLNDLISILQVIPLNHIKHFVSQQIDELDLECCKNIYYTQLSIDEIFPSDIIQYILSFGGLYHTKGVSKKWKLYSEQNEQNHLKKLYTMINKIISPVKYDENINKTFIIDQHRTKLHKIEIDLGYKGPMEDIFHKTLSICKPGDRLLVHDGDYYMSFIDSHPEGDVSTQIIGIGAAVTITALQTNFQPFWCVGNAYADNITTECAFRNIKFDFSETRGVGFIVAENATLHLENCELTCGKKKDVVWALPGSYLDINNCRFINHGSNSSITFSPNAKEVNIIDCTFENCGIKITDGYDHYGGQRANDEMVQLKCVGNIFDLGNNSLGDFHPITEIHTLHDNYVGNSDQYTLKDNLLKVIMPSGNDEINPNKIKVIHYT